MIILRQKSFNIAYTESLKQLSPIKRIKAQIKRGKTLDKVLEMRNGGKYGDFFGPREDKVKNALKKAKELRLEQEAEVHELARASRRSKKPIPAYA